MPYIFKLWLSEVPEYVVVFCKLLLMRCLIDQMFVPLTASIAAVGNIKNFQMFTSILNFIPLVVSFLLFDAGAPPFTLYVVFIVYSLISSGLILHFARIHCNISVFFFLTNIVMRCIVSFMLIYVLSTIPIFFINPGLSRLTIVLVLHIFSFSLITWVVGFMPEEKEEVLTIKNRIVSILKDKLVK
jgi:hypothetical protein